MAIKKQELQHEGERRSPSVRPFCACIEGEAGFHLCDITVFSDQCLSALMNRRAAQWLENCIRRYKDAI